jgi:hypothetical protein
MAKSIQQGAANYARSREKAIAKWNASKGSMPARWSEGLREAGTTPGPISTQAYATGIQGAQYNYGNADKWARNFAEGISR